MEKLRARFLWTTLVVFWLVAVSLLLRAALYGVIPSPTRFGSKLITFAEAPFGFVISCIIMTGVFVAIPLMLRSIWKASRDIEAHVRRRAPIDKAIRQTENDR